MEETKTEIEERTKKPILAPKICSWTSEDELHTIIEIVLPGVEKDTIKLRMNEETVFVVGEADDVRYVGGYGLCCAVAPEKAHSTYKNGLLRIEVPFLEEKFHTVDVAID